MLIESFQRTVNPEQLASGNSLLEGQILQKELHRFSAHLMEAAGEVEFRLRFKKKRGGKIHVAGKAKTQVIMSCQYCLEPVALKVNALIAQVILSEEEEVVDLDVQQDYLLIEGELIELASIIEDDLILNLPMVARHGADDCEASDSRNCLGRLKYEQQQELPEVNSGPFAVLNQLKVEKPTD